MLFVAGAILLETPDCLFAATNNVIGSYTNWPTHWLALNSLNDPNDGLANTQLDFVGNTTNAGAYYASNSEYVFFRQRVQVGTIGAGTFHDSHFVLIDTVGQDYNTTTKTLQVGNDGLPDYGFTWDSKSNDSAKHGLEMMVRLATNAQWSGVQMDDIDGLNAAKGTNDINGGGRTTDGYLRTIDQQSSSNFGMTAFIDYAVKWSYLQAFTGLASNQSWRIVFASIPDRTDHNTFAGGDISGGASPSSSVTQGWTTVYMLSTAVELRLYETADKLFVELCTVDEVAAGQPIEVFVKYADGTSVKIGEVLSLGGSQQYLIEVERDWLQGQEAFTLMVVDESGAVHQRSGVTLQEFKAGLGRLDKYGVTLTWASLPGRYYDVYVCTRLGDPWRKVSANILAERTVCSAIVPISEGRQAFYKIEMQVAK